MGIAVLAPVPASILKSAIETCVTAGRVAFGSKVWNVFDKATTEYGKGIPVLICPTGRKDDPDELCPSVGYVNFRSLYLGTVQAVAGRHPNPDVRPSATISDTDDWDFFWEVSNLHKLAKQDQIAITDLISEGNGKPLTKSYPLYRPILVTASFL